MGYAVARAARRRGHDVRLISGPVSLNPPAGLRVVAVSTAADMLRAARASVGWCDALVMAAAVADWRPAVAARGKLKKRAMPRVLRLAPTPDILQRLAPRKGRRVFVGFAAETGAPLPEARRKLQTKRLDLIVGNDISRPGSGFDVDTNEVVLLFADGATIALPLMTKARVASRIVREIERLRTSSR